MKIKEAIKEVNSDISTLISKPNFKMFFEILIGFVLIVGTLGSGLASIIWTGMAIFQPVDNLIDNFKELILIAWTTFGILGYSWMVFCKVIDG